VKSSISEIGPKSTLIILTPLHGDYKSYENLEFFKLYTLQMSFHISKIHFDIFIHSYAPSMATGFPMHSISL
jgi:hypothetical protein